MTRLDSQKQKARDQVMSHVVAEWRKKESGASPRQVAATAPSGAAPSPGLTPCCAGGCVAATATAGSLKSTPQWRGHSGPPSPNFLGWAP